MLFLFNAFPTDLSRWRWGDVENTISALIDLELPLRRGWDVNDLQNTVKAGVQAGQFKGAVDIATCTAAVTSDFFWSFVKMVAVLAAIGNHLSLWLQGCYMVLSLCCHTEKHLLLDQKLGW